MPIIRNPFRRTEETGRTNGIEKSTGAIEAPPRHIDIKEPTEMVKLSGKSRYRVTKYLGNMLSMA